MTHHQLDNPIHCLAIKRLSGHNHSTGTNLFFHIIIGIQSIVSITTNDSDSEAVAIRVAQVSLIAMTQVFDLHPVDQVVWPPTRHGRWISIVWQL